jgi:hypothetical protein
MTQLGVNSSYWGESLYLGKEFYLLSSAYALNYFLFVLIILRLLVPLQPKPKQCRIMTTLAQRITDTPMAPYMGLIRGMSLEEKQVVVAFIVDSMKEQEPKNNAEIIREKYRRLQVSPELRRLRGCIKLTEEDLKDERTQYILNR